jgi:hypothetical protein
MVGGVDQQQLPALAAPGRLGDDPAIGIAPSRSPTAPTAWTATSRFRGVSRRGHPARHARPASKRLPRSLFCVATGLYVVRTRGGGPRRGGMSSVFRLCVGHSGARIPPASERSPSPRVGLAAPPEHQGAWRRRRPHPARGACKTPARILGPNRRSFAWSELHRLATVELIVTAETVETPGIQPSGQRLGG